MKVIIGAIEFNVLCKIHPTRNFGRLWFGDYQRRPWWMGWERGIERMSRRRNHLGKNTGLWPCTRFVQKIKTSLGYPFNRSKW